MADRVYPSKPNSNLPQTLKPNGNPSFPPTKAQLYNRPIYRPQPKPQRRRRRRRSCCCICCLWTTLLIITILVLAAIAGAALWVLYRPHRPTFTVTSLQISQFNVTTSSDGSSTKLKSKLNLTVVARNPNKKLVFIYDTTDVTMSSSGVDVGKGTLPAFTHGTKNTTVLKGTVSSAGEDLDLSSVSSLKSDLKKGGIPLVVEMDTKVKLKMGGLKTSKVMIRVICKGLKANVPKGKTPATLSSSSDTTCVVKLRIKIWKWTF
ncbi:NDR1/HIN1-like protein 10 [Macadamia integrifolia]|uniref:NDR1/HIN1-like protein 10 n=1 Tax=Macadamia integrifolia TaxID=60698 RepID=UPI001C50138F|nr:NDR1/HIN1-like protein 10 [Macadamia integrifolia]